MSTPSQVRRYRSCKAGIGWEMWESLHFVKRRLLGRSSLGSELRTLRILRGGDATVDVLGCVNMHPRREMVDDAVVCLRPFPFRVKCIHIRRGLRSCLSF